uniref:(California timema) hypothetical protein n=1 Tax=Timema californicum TaxID=61474 RepID=A0A7R9J7W2_TIMCA|nr:unnamed protein product [Timema californicum]
MSFEVVGETEHARALVSISSSLGIKHGRGTSRRDSARHRFVYERLPALTERVEEGGEESCGNVRRRGCGSGRSERVCCSENFRAALPWQRDPCRDGKFVYYPSGGTFAPFPVPDLRMRGAWAAYTVSPHVMCMYTNYANESEMKFEFRGRVPAFARMVVLNSISCLTTVAQNEGHQPQCKPYIGVRDSNIPRVLRITSQVGRRVHRDEAEGVLESVTCQRLVKIASDISP